MEKKDIELLQFIRQNAQMGTVTLTALADMLESSALKKTILRQIDEYTFVYDAAGSKLIAAGEDAKNVNPFAKFAATAMLNIQSVTDKSESHIAEMVIIGSMRGIIAITRHIRDYAVANADFINLAYRLLAIEQRNVDDLKRYI